MGFKQGRANPEASDLVHSKSHIFVDSYSNYP